MIGTERGVATMREASSSPREAGVERVTSPARCSGCGAAFETHAWRRLELVERVGPERVREVLTTWPDDVIVEVRRCLCGRALARKARAGSGRE